MVSKYDLSNSTPITLQQNFVMLLREHPKMDMHKTEYRKYISSCKIDDTYLMTVVGRIINSCLFVRWVKNNFDGHSPITFLRGS